MKTLLKACVLLGLSAFAAAVFAQPSLFVEGTHYTKIADPVRTSDPNKIEVNEIFWYGCPHCYAFEPLIQSWEHNIAADVEFVRSPGMWNRLMQVHAQIYYVAQTLGVLDKLHSVVFDEFHQKNNYLQDEAAVKALFVSHGVDTAEFDKAWKSFSVTSAVKKAESRMRDYGVRGVPSMVVNGKYLVTIGDGVKSQVEMLKIVDYLIGKERSGS